MRFEVYVHGGDTWFRLVGRDDAPLLVSGPQPDLPTALEHIGELKAATSKGAFFRSRRSPGRAYYFTIEAANAILATSHLYENRRDRDATMTLVRERLADAAVTMRELEAKVDERGPAAVLHRG